MKLLATFLVCYLIGSTTSAFAQQKHEVERGVREEAVPAPALGWLDQIAPEDKVQWYFEETSGKKSFEAKYKKNGTRYSVEFDTTGVLEDVEIIKRWGDLAPELQQELLKHFETTYRKHKIRKIQQQISGDEQVVRKWLLDGNAPDIVYRYEIEYYAKSENGKALWEGVFDDKGVELSKRKVILRPTDNLNY